MSPGGWHAGEPQWQPAPPGLELGMPGWPANALTALSPPLPNQNQYPPKISLAENGVAKEVGEFTNASQHSVILSENEHRYEMLST